MTKFKVELWSKKHGGYWDEDTLLTIEAEDPAYAARKYPHPNDDERLVKVTWRSDGRWHESVFRVSHVVRVEKVEGT